MDIQRITGMGSLRPTAPALMAMALAAMVLTAGGPAGAAVQPGTVRAPQAGPAAAGGDLAAGAVSTVAGGVGGPAKGTQVALFSACGVSFAGRYLYAGDGGAVRKVSLSAGWLSTPAGTGAAAAPLGDGGPATRAFLDGACGVAVDHAGNLVIADTGDQRVRVVAASAGTFYGQPMTSGHIYTVAGDGNQGSSGNGGPATSAELDDPHGVAVDGAGNLVIAATYDQQIRVVAASAGTFYGQSMTAGDIYTVAGDGKRGRSGDGGKATSATLNDPHAVAVDGAGNLVIADMGNFRIRVVAASAGTFYGQSMTAGDIYTVAGDGQRGSSGDGGPAASAELNLPHGVAVDGAGNLVIADSSNFRIRVVAASNGTFYGQSMTAGDIYTVAGDGRRGVSGDGGLATRAELHDPEGVAVDGGGNLVVADSGNERIRVVAARTGTFYGQSMTAGDIYTVAGDGPAGFSGDGGPATRAELRGPQGVAVDGAGDLVVADSADNRIRLSAARTGTLYGQPMTAGDMYTVAGDGTVGFSGDGGKATRAELSGPEGVAVDGAGNLVIADTYNQRIRVVAGRTGTFYGQSMTAGDIYTVAGGGASGLGDGGPAISAQLNYPEGVAVDGAGNLVIADTNNFRIRVVASSTGTFYGQSMTAGDIYTVAGDGSDGSSGDGGPAISAELSYPVGVAVDGAGNLVITDTNNQVVRVVAASTGAFYGQSMTAGDIYTVAGDGILGFSGDGGPATSAAINYPQGVAVDGAGNLVIADTYNNRIRVVAASTGMFYGQSMTAGDIYTVAGDGIRGFSGDGGPATSAELNLPDGVAVDGGNLVTADTSNNRIRAIAG
jgi:trimeric autotransporter adhesin